MPLIDHHGINLIDDVRDQKDRAGNDDRVNRAGNAAFGFLLRRHGVMMSMLPVKITDESGRSGSPGMTGTAARYKTRLTS